MITVIFNISQSNKREVNSDTCGWSPREKINNLFSLYVKLAFMCNSHFNQY